MPLSAGQVLNNRYRINILLGQGGFGAVYHAWDMNMECSRALKENLNTSPASQNQFKHEAQILEKLSHPNLLKEIDHFIIPDQGQYLGEVMQGIGFSSDRSVADAEEGRSLVQRETANSNLGINLQQEVTTRA